MDYPTAEEEYELMYGEELEMMEDFEGSLVYKLLNTFRTLIFSEPARVAPIASTQKSTTTPHVNKTILSSPALSQISRDGLNFTPAPGGKQKTSTPFLDKLKAFPTQSQDEISTNGALSEIQNIGVKRKRRLEDLFGDIYDIEEEDNFMKKHKTEEEKDLDTIARIIEARTVFQTQINPLKKSNFDRLEALHKFKRENLSRSIPK